MVNALDQERSVEETSRRSFWSWPWPLARYGLIAYLVFLGWFIATYGLPVFDRVQLTGFVVVGLLAAQLGHPWREQIRVFVDWIPILLVLIIYDHTRGVADTLGMPVRVMELVDSESALFGGVLPTSWLQERLFEPGTIHWYDTVASVTYFSHFVFSWVIAAVFYVVSRPLWAGYIRRFLLVWYLGLAIYILVPAAPPWYAAWYGYVPDSMERISGNGWWNLGLGFADQWLEQAQGGANHVAAMPSLHGAFSMLVAVTLWPLVAKWRPWARLPARVVFASYPVLMCWSLVYTAEHYVIDILAGWLLVALVGMIARAWERADWAVSTWPSRGFP